MNLYLLPLGSCRVDKGVALTPGVDVGEFINTPVWAALLDTPVGWVLVDTGMHPIHIEEPDATFKDTPYAGKIQPIMEQEDFIVDRLATVDVVPEDIRYVINTHLHFDHCGGNAWFPAATFILQKTEYEVALETPGEFHRRDYDIPEIDYHLIEGPYTLYDGVELIPTPGHTRGHQSLLVDLDARPVILPADAIVLREVLRGVPGAWFDPAVGAASVQRLRELAERAGAEMLISHDQELWESWPHAPEPFA